MNKKLKEFKVHFLEEIPSDDYTKEEIKVKLGIKPSREKNNNKKSFLRILKPTLISCFSFVFVAITFILVFTLVGYQSVPVYKGMSAENISSDRKLLSKEQSYSNFIDDEVGIVIDNKIVCYANPNDSVIVSIDLYNPNSYEIISFTLNGIVYQTFQFLEGSTSNKIFVEFTVQDESGIQSISIDAIKYVKNTSIKLARFEGNKTIQLGVTYQDGPTVSIDDETVTNNKLHLDLNISNPYDLVANNGFKIYLFNEDELVLTKTLKEGLNKVDFDNLKFNNSYHYIVIGVCDLYDGSGKKAHTLIEGTIDTAQGISYQNVTSTSNSISLNFESLKDSNIQIKEVALYLEDELIKKLDLNESSYMFSDLLSNTEYLIKTTYAYEYDGSTTTDEIIYVVKTQEEIVPTAKFTSGVGVMSIIYAEVEIYDPLERISSLVVELYQNNTLVKTITNIENLTINEETKVATGNLTFSNVEKGEYMLVLKYQYNLNDGKGDITIDKDSIDVDNTLTVVLD